MVIRPLPGNKKRRVENDRSQTRHRGTELQLRLRHERRLPLQPVHLQELQLLIERAAAWVTGRRHGSRRSGGDTL